MSEMVFCPKCSCAEISGPRYVVEVCFNGFSTNERLRYTCRGCGYHEDHPTHDSEKRAAEIAEAMREFRRIFK